MIQDIFPHRLYNEFRPGSHPQERDRVLCFVEDAPLFRLKEGEVCFPSWEEFSQKPTVTYAFCVDEERYFLCVGDPEEIPQGYESRSIRQMRQEARGPRDRIFAAYTGYHLNHWYRSNRYCGRCGGKTLLAPDERAIDCPSCRQRIYPRIQPAVIVGVTHQDSLLITRYADRHLAVQALVAGFAEIGETFEQTVEREVMEEVGLRVKNIRYYKSQPWGIADDLLAGFYCDVDGDPTVKLDEKELKEAIWVSRKEIVGQPDDFSLTNEMMIHFREM